MLRDLDLTPLDRIEAFLSSPIIALRDHADRRGCFLCNAAADRAALDSDTAELVRRGYSKMRNAIADALRMAFPKLTSKTLDARSELVLTVYSGLRIMARAGLESDNLVLARDAVLTALDQTESTDLR